MALLPLYSKDGNTDKLGGALGPAGGSIFHLKNESRANCKGLLDFHKQMFYNSYKPRRYRL